MTVHATAAHARRSVSAMEGHFRSSATACAEEGSATAQTRWACIIRRPRRTSSSVQTLYSFFLILDGPALDEPRSSLVRARVGECRLPIGGGWPPPSTPAGPGGRTVTAERRPEAERSRQTEPGAHPPLVGPTAHGRHRAEEPQRPQWAERHPH